MSLGKRSANDAKIAREIADLKAILADLPGNPIPWAAVLRIAAPFIARLAVRMALKKAKRDMSEDKVNAIAGAVSAVLRTVLGTSIANIRTDAQGDGV
ncbi:hypothetical protein ES705_49377 [subsurface metagenome]